MTCADPGENVGIFPASGKRGSAVVQEKMSLFLPHPPNYTRKLACNFSPVTAGSCFHLSLRGNNLFLQEKSFGSTLLLLLLRTLDKVAIRTSRCLLCCGPCTIQSMWGESIRMKWRRQIPWAPIKHASLDNDPSLHGEEGAGRELHAGAASPRSVSSEISCV